MGMQAGKDLQNCRLAATRGADQGDQLTRCHIQGDVGYRKKLLAASPIHLAHAIEADERFAQERISGDEISRHDRAIDKPREAKLSFANGLIVYLVHRWETRQ